DHRDARADELEVVGPDPQLLAVDRRLVADLPARVLAPVVLLPVEVVAAVVATEVGRSDVADDVVGHERAPEGGPAGAVFAPGVEALDPRRADAGPTGPAVARRVEDEDAPVDLVELGRPEAVGDPGRPLVGREDGADLLPGDEVPRLVDRERRPGAARA